MPPKKREYVELCNEKKNEPKTTKTNSVLEDAEKELYTMSIGMETLKKLSKEDKQKALLYAEYINGQREETTSANSQGGISDITSLFRELPAGSQKEALAAMEHISKYENMDFWDYQNKVFEMSGELTRLKNLFLILDGFFNCGEKKFAEDKIERAVFVRSYAKMQSLVHAMWDITNNVAEVADVLSSAEFYKSERE